MSADGNKNNFKIMVIDDNPDIHQDFIKILTSSSVSEFDNLRQELFGAPKLKSDIELPIFEIDVATQGQEGVKKLKKH